MKLSPEQKDALLASYEKMLSQFPESVEGDDMENDSEVENEMSKEDEMEDEMEGETPDMEEEGMGKKRMMGGGPRKGALIIALGKMRGK